MVEPVQTQTQTLEPQKTAEPQVTQTPQEPNKPTPTSSPDDLVTRASEVTIESTEKKPASPAGDILEDSGFDYGKWQSMLASLPEEQRSQLESAYKSLQRGAEKKFQKAADLRKQAEADLSQPWTQERIHQVVNDPTFVREAQAYAQVQNIQQNPSNSGISAEEWSYLSDEEKAKFHQLAQNQNVLQSQMNQMLLAQQDEQLKSRYKNYDSQRVNQLRNDLLQGRVNATSEHLWQVIDYEDYGKRCYELGKQDRQMEVGEKLNASPTSSMGMNGMNVTQANEVPAKGEKEGTVDYFKRLAMRNMEKLKQAGQTR